MNIQDLQNRRNELSLMSEIPFDYAEQWNKLAADFRTMGAMSNAALCESNWKRYKPMVSEYVRAEIGGIVTLVPVVGVLTDCCEITEAEAEDAAEGMG